MKLLTQKTTVNELQQMANHMFGNLVKAVVDIEKNLIVVDAELHSDQESLLLENGSNQQDLWGINLYPEFSKNNETFIEFDSMINLRPSENNKSRFVENPEIRKKIIQVVQDWII